MMMFIPETIRQPTLEDIQKRILTDFFDEKENERVKPLYTFGEAQEARHLLLVDEESFTLLRNTEKRRLGKDQFFRDDTTPQRENYLEIRGGKSVNGTYHEGIIEMNPPRRINLSFIGHTWLMNRETNGNSNSLSGLYRVQ